MGRQRTVERQQKAEGSAEATGTEETTVEAMRNDETVKIGRQRATRRQW